VGLPLESLEQFGLNRGQLAALPRVGHGVIVAPQPSSSQQVEGGRAGKVEHVAREIVDASVSRSFVNAALIQLE